MNQYEPINSRNFAKCSDSKNSDYVLSGTFYGIEKACRVVVQCCREAGTYAKILYIFEFCDFFNRKIGQTLFIWL